MQLFYSPEIASKDTSFTFNKDESRHIHKVLRKKIDDILFITNGKGFLFTGKIIVANDKSCCVTIIEESFIPPKPYKLHIAIAPTKMNDRMEWFLEKATEIGIDEITPILCHNSERKVIKEERFQKIIQSAMKQSLQYYLPKLNPLTKFSELLSKVTNEAAFIAHCEPDHKILFKNAIVQKNDLLILIGPEGDFSTEEITMAINKNITPVSLGDTRLRTETAGIVAAHTVALGFQK